MPNIMDFIASLLEKVPNKNHILLQISDHYAGNKEYIKNYRTPILKDMAKERYLKYKEQHIRGTISLVAISKNIEKELAKDGFYLSSEAIRKALNDTI